MGQGGGKRVRFYFPVSHDTLGILGAAMVPQWPWRGYRCQLELELKVRRQGDQGVVRLR